LTPPSTNKAITDWTYWSPQVKENLIYRVGKYCLHELLLWLIESCYGSSSFISKTCHNSYTHLCPVLLTSYVHLYLIGFLPPEYALPPLGGVVPRIELVEKYYVYPPWFPISYIFMIYQTIFNQNRIKRTNTIISVMTSSSWWTVSR
jgi:hypothetical protein